MTTILTQPRRKLGMTAAVVVLLCGLSQLAVAADSWLAIHQTNDHEWLYTLNEIEHMTYGTNELYVTTANGTDTYALEAIVRIEFIPDTTTVGVDGPGGRPVSIDPSHLFQNYPNPFSPETQIAFDLPSAGRAEIRIYDAKGRLIRMLIDEKRPAGLNSVSWDGRDGTGRAVATGVYFYSLTAPGVDENRRMILVK
jgi:flagellar hook assembly protein FlgD